MTKILGALSVMLLMLAVACSSEESQTSAVDIEATVEARVALAMASQPVATPVVEVVVTATPRATPTPTHLLEILDMRCQLGDYGYAHVEGRVKNVSNKNLENVTAVASWYTSGDTFITSDTALIEYNPILPGQTSPFKTFSTLNPAMNSCRLNFKFLLGGTIPTLQKVSTPTPTATPTPTPTPYQDQGPRLMTSQEKSRVASMSTVLASITPTPAPYEGPRVILPLSVGDSWHFNGNGDGKAKYPISVIGDWNVEWEINNGTIVDAQIPFNLRLTGRAGRFWDISVSTSVGEHALNFEDYDSVTLSVEADYSTLWTIRLNPK